MSYLLNRRGLDQAGSCLSVACAIHCCLKPLLLVLPSVAGLDFFLSEDFEGYMLSVGILLASGTVIWGYAQHGNESVLLVLLSAFVLIAVGRFLVPQGMVERLFVIPGGGLVAVTHWLNVRFSDCSGSCPGTIAQQ